MFFNLFRKAALEAKLQEAWESTTFAKKMAAKAKRATMNDLDRFKVMIARKHKSFRLRQLAALKKAPAKAKAAPAK